MGVMRIACCLFVAILCSLGGAAAASADEVLVLGKDGRVYARDDRALPPVTMKAPPRRTRVVATTAAKKRKRTVYSELKRLRNRGAITPEQYTAGRAAYVDARRRSRRFDGIGYREMRAVIATLDGIAARRQLTPSRITPLWLTLQRNLEWWSTGRSLGSGQRIEFEGSELVWQYYPGQGLQLQMLGNFGKLNGLWGSRQNAKLAFMLDELLPLAAERAGGVAWEYYFSFGGGRPPWVSGLAQGTAVQALARSARRLHREADVLPIAKRGLAIFHKRTPTGVRVPEERGDHYAIYSYAPSLRVLNGFIQSLVGLYDYARISKDPEGTALFQAAEPEARREVPQYDTGAWSLYARGSSTSESSLSYHDLLQGFLANLCERTDVAVYCTTAENFETYKTVPPELEVKPRTLRGGRYGRVAFTLSKISSVTLQISRGARTVEARPFGAVGYGNRTFGWQVPRRAGKYEVVLTARDLAGNIAADSTTVRVLKPKRPKRP
jgi:D-glucuronyl C5-epimerase-like protein